MKMLYLVCDGGGTKTDFLLFDEKGNVLAADRQGGANANFIAPQQAADAVVEGISRCLSQAGASPADIRLTSLFIPGFRPAMERLEARFPQMEFRQAGDEKNAFYAALGLPYGIAVLAGTGSFATGCSRDGRSTKAGGWGPLFGDEGSGYHIGVLCLARLARLSDQGRAGSVLEQEALRFLNLEDVPALREAAYQPDFTRARVAQLSRVVAKAAALGDEDACAILDQAAAELAELAAVVAARLGEQDLPVSLTGGLTAMGELFCGRFRTKLSAVLPRSTYVPAKYTPVIGAALCVLSEEAGVDIRSAELLRNLLQKEKGDTDVDG